jgi:TolA-binding protein
MIRDHSGNISGTVVHAVYRGCTGPNAALHHYPPEEETTMNNRRMIVGIGLVLCIFAAFTAGVSAEPMQGKSTEHNGTGTGQGMLAYPGEVTQFHYRVANPDEVRAQVREQVQNGEEVRSVWSDYRLKLLDLRIESASELLATFEENGVDMSEARAVLARIGDLREELAAAFEAGDRDAVKEIYEELVPLWKEFRDTVREAARAEIAESWFEEAFLRGEYALLRASDVINHLADEGYDIGELKELYADAEGAYDEAREAYTAGDLDAAKEKLQEFRALFSRLIDTVRELVGETDETAGLEQAIAYASGQTGA